MKKIIGFICAVVISFCDTCFSEEVGLLQPTGQYGVGFQVFHWLNDSFGTDFNFTGKNFEDFNETNKNHTHQLMTLVYYPTNLKSSNNSIYDNPFIKAQREEILQQVSNIDKKALADLRNIRSYASQNAPLIAGQEMLPVVFFSPGFGYPVQAYENIITELVSRGYIVVGINTAFINPFALENGHIVLSASNFSEEELVHKLIPLQMSDLIFTKNILKRLQEDNNLFSRMDLDRISLLGHSLGAISVANIAHQSPNDFISAVTLDIGYDPSGKSLLPFKIPLMHIIAADRKLPPPDTQISPVLFDLNKDNYLAVISPNEKNHEYSSHDNFTDLSSLQNLASFQELKNFRFKKFSDGFTFKVNESEPTDIECNDFKKVTYVLFKREDKWGFAVYDDKTKIHDLDVTMVAGLSETLSNFYKKAPHELAASEIASLEKVMRSLHYVLFGKSFLGKGNGNEIGSCINLYVVDFFNTFVKGEKNSFIEKCNVYNSPQFLDHFDRYKLEPKMGELSCASKKQLILLTLRAV